MFDIDKALSDIEFEIHQPSERLRESTRQMVDGEVRNKQNLKRTGKLSWAIPAVAAMLAALMFLFVLPPAADEVSYITIDINPSMSMQVNASGTVLSIAAENDDASVLLKNMTLTGLSFDNALEAVVEAADAQGYLKDNGHVLVACFGENTAVSQQQVEKTVSGSTRHAVNVLLLKSSKETFENAKAHHQSPGVELLKKQASDQGIKEQDVDKIIDQVFEKKYKKEKSQNTQTQPEKDEVRPTDPSKGQSQKDNASDKKENEQNQQNNGSQSGKEVKENSSPSNKQDKPKDNNKGNHDNGENQNKNNADKKEDSSNKENTNKKDTKKQ